MAPGGPTGVQASDQSALLSSCWGAGHPRPAAHLKAPPFPPSPQFLPYPLNAGATLPLSSSKRSRFLVQCRYFKGGVCVCPRP